MGVGRWLAASLVALATMGLLHVHAPARIAAAAIDPGADDLLRSIDDSVDPTTTSTARPAPEDPAPCPDEMILVSGMYCAQPKHVCARWMDPTDGPYAYYRCAEYESPATCESPARESKRFCIDREEYVRPGDALPLVNQSWTSASRVCASQGKRVCEESEWNFACEGEEMRPYPYGFTRDSSICNIDRNHLGKREAGLTDLRAPVSAYPMCVSPFGVHDMSGNVEEWATLDHGKAPERSVMKGAWWLPGKNTCRAETLGHGEIYGGPQVGVRCCAGAR